MNKKRIIIVFSLVFIFILIIVAKAYFSAIAYSQVIDISSVPASVIMKLNSTDLKRGAYLFTSSFENNGEVYFAIVGPGKYSDSYNLKITDIIRDKTTKKTTVMLKDFTDKKVKNNLYDFSLFRLKSPLKIKDDNLVDRLEFILNDKKLPLNKWWGSNKTEGQAGDYSFKVIENDHEIDKKVLQHIQNSDFKLNRCYIYSPYIKKFMPNYYMGRVFSFDIPDLYIVISHGKYSSINIENITTWSGSKYNDLYFNVGYSYNDLKSSKPYSIVKISSERLLNRYNTMHGVTWRANIGVSLVQNIDVQLNTQDIYCEYVVNPEYCDATNE